MKKALDLVRRTSFQVLLLLLSITAFSQSKNVTGRVTDSTNTLVQPTTKKPYSQFVSETGFVAAGSPSFNTTTICPTDFYPFITVTAGEVTESAGANIKDFKACVTSLDTNATNYTVNMSMNANYKTYGAIQHTQPGSYYVYYVSTSNDAFNTGTARPVPKISFINPSVTPDTNRINKLSYVLYCYPTGMPTPTAATCP